MNYTYTFKDFFKKNSHLKLSLQHTDAFGGGYKIQIYNTTYDMGIKPVYERFMQDIIVDRLNVDFETAIMTPIIKWWEDVENMLKEGGE